MTRALSSPGGDVTTVICAVVGGVLGYHGFVLLLDHGSYALVLPGGLAGLVAGIPRSRAGVVPILCGIIGIVAGLLAEHRFAPFVADEGLWYFFTHAHNLKPMTLILIGLGGFIGFWVPFRRRVRRAA